MPNGYTQNLYSGKPTTMRDYLIDVARGFGAFIMFRDHSFESGELPEMSPEPPSYEKDWVDRAQAELDRVLAWTLKEAEEAQEKEIAEKEAYQAERIEKENGIAERYVAMMAQVRQWVPPTDEHDNLKQTALKYLEESLEFDTGSSKYYDPPKRVSPSQYRKEKIDAAAKNLTRAQTSYAEAVERAASRYAWVQAFVESLPDA